MYRSSYRTFNAICLVALGMVVIAIVLAGWLHNHLGRLYPVCTLEHFTGNPCPLCGLTTSLHALLTGHPARAIHPLTIPAAILLLLEIIWRTGAALQAWIPATAQKALRWDGRVHLALLSLYLMYAAIFFAMNA